MLVAVLARGAGHGDLHGARAEILVESFAGITGQEIDSGLVAILDGNGILAAVGLLEAALGAAAFTGDGLLGSVDGEETTSEGDGESEFSEMLHRSLGNAEI